MPGVAMGLTATILGVVGLGEIADSLDGIDLSHLLKGRAERKRRQFFWQADLYDFGKQRAIRDGHLKYIEHGNTQFLFDLREDIGERRNLFLEEPGLAARLRARLIEWQRSHEGIHGDQP